MMPCYGQPQKALETGYTFCSAAEFREGFLKKQTIKVLGIIHG
jgi:hypothetical protein